MQKDSNEALNAVREPAGREAQRRLGWLYAGLAEARRCVISVAAIWAVVVLARGEQQCIRSNVAVWAIVAIALPTHVGDLFSFGRRIVGGEGDRSR